MDTDNLEALVRLLDDPRLGSQAEAELARAGLIALPALQGYADTNPTHAAQIIEQISASDHEQAWAQLACRPNLEKAVLLLCRCVDPFADTSEITTRLDELANALRGDLPATSRDYRKEAVALAGLTRINNFRGNRADYYSPNNWLLHKVLQSKLGVPISLTILYVLVGRRLQAPVYAISLPMHPVVRYGDEPSPLYIDPYDDGALMTEKECRQMLLQRRGIPFRAQSLLPLNDHQIVQHLLQGIVQCFYRLKRQALYQQLHHYLTIWCSVEG